jgi:HKD family nuclease
MEHWYDINLKQPLGDRDYQNYVLFNLFQYVDMVDVTLMNSPYHSISALFESEEHANKFSRENGNFVQSIKRSIDREMLKQRTYLTQDSLATRLVDGSS